MPEEHRINSVRDLLRDDVAMKIVHVMADKYYASVTELSVWIRLDDDTVSRKLKDLQNLGLVEPSKEAGVYKITKKGLAFIKDMSRLKF